MKIKKFKMHILWLLILLMLPSIAKAEMCFFKEDGITNSTNNQIDNYDQCDAVSVIDVDMSQLDILKEFKNLKTVMLGNMDISDITIVNNLPSLEQLIISGSKVNLDGINSNITSLTISESVIVNTNLTALKNLKSLKSLSLGNGNEEIEDGIIQEYVDGVYIRDLTGIENLSQLEDLTVSYNIYSTIDFSPIMKLKNLKKIDVAGLEHNITQDFLNYISENKIETEDDLSMYVDLNSRLNEILKSVPSSNKTINVFVFTSFDVLLLSVISTS